MQLIIPAFISGFFMFLAPCTLPLIPGVFGFLFTGRQNLAQRVTRIGLFLMGFSLIFVAFSLFGAGIVRVFGADFREVVARFSGAVILLFGLMMIFSGVSQRGFGWMQKYSLRFPQYMRQGSKLSSFLLGLTFATGWTPCVGPILGTVLTLSVNTRTQGQGIFLLGAFLLGFAVPFVLVAVFQSWFESKIHVGERFEMCFRYIAGGILVVLGFAFLFEQMGPLIQWMFEIFDPIDYDGIYRFL